jgi:transposase-like protein
VSTAVHPHVRCPSCGHTRVVTARQARRVRAGEHNGVCRDCRGHRKPSTDENLRFWLERYGTTPAAGVSARATIVAGGAPHELVILATTVFPNP